MCSSGAPHPVLQFTRRSSLSNALPNHSEIVLAHRKRYDPMASVVIPSKDERKTAVFREGCRNYFRTLINGPWDMTALDRSNDNGGGNASLFVTNVLNGTVKAHGSVVHGGTVVRVDLTLSSGAAPFVEAMTVIGSGFAERTDPAALVIWSYWPRAQQRRLFPPRGRQSQQPGCCDTFSPVSPIVSACRNHHLERWRPQRSLGSHGRSKW